MAMALLPLKVVIMPVVFRFARGEVPELFQVSFSGTEERAGQPLAQFVREFYPEIQSFKAAKELKGWWETAGDKPKVLVAGSSSGAKKEKKQFMQVQRIAHMWAEFFEFALADTDVAKAVAPGVKDRRFAVTLQGGETKVASDATVLADLMKEMFYKGVKEQVPHLTVRNHQQLCGEQGMGRTLCLLLVDDEDGSRSTAALKEVKASGEAYAQELADLKASDEGATEEPFHIQPVRVMTSTSRWPWQPVAVGSAFHPIWAEAKNTKAFIMELETKRVGAIKTSSLQEIYQQIAYEDLKLVDFPDGVSLLSALPDPEVRLKRELARFLSSLPGAALAYVILAAAVAVVPEVPLAHAGAVLALLFSVLVGAWPVACRKCVAIFWCVTSPSSFQCQV